MLEAAIVRFVAAPVFGAATGAYAVSGARWAGVVALVGSFLYTSGVAGTCDAKSEERN